MRSLKPRTSWPYQDQEKVLARVSTALRDTVAAAGIERLQRIRNIEIQSSQSFAFLASCISLSNFYQIGAPNPQKAIEYNVLRNPTKITIHDHEEWLEPFRHSYFLMFQPWTRIDWSSDFSMLPGENTPEVSDIFPHLQEILVYVADVLQSLKLMRTPRGNFTVRELRWRSKLDGPANWQLFTSSMLDVYEDLL